MTRIIVGDCLDVLPTLEADHFHACVTDPPYHLTSIVKRFGAKEAAPAKSDGATGVYRRSSAGFMGQQWDGGDVAMRPETWAAVARVLRPGAHLVAFGGTRTFHRVACAIEDAGFEIRDTLMWVYGSGFPKSRNQKGEWQGWGTALKPAWEPIILARKPLDGTVAQNLAKWGCGALNVDGCRVDGGQRPLRVIDPKATANGAVYAERRQAGSGFDGGSKAAGTTGSGRWPANLVHDGSQMVLDLFPGSAGAAVPVQGSEPSTASVRNVWGRMGRVPGVFHADTGSAARFFYCAKASRADRNHGCDELEALPLHWSSGDQSPGTFQAEGTDKTAKNPHPTVKPTALMQWLVRLVTPPGGHVIDPFAGSGSTGRGCALEGMAFTGVGRSPRTRRSSRRRIAAVNCPSVPPGAPPEPSDERAEYPGSQQAPNVVSGDMEGR